MRQATVRHTVGLAVLLGLGLALGARANDIPSFVRMDAGIADIGQPLSVAVVSQPDYHFVLAASPRRGFRQTRYGVLCLDPARAVVLRDSIRGSDPPLDGTGRYDLTLQVPNRPRLLGLEVIFQAAAHDPRYPLGIQLSRSEARIIGNGSRGNFRGSPVGLLPGEWDAVLATPADLDGDGDPDLLVRGGSRTWLLVNGGDGSFVDGTNGPGTGWPQLPRTAGLVAFVDVDQDGDLDVLFGVNGLPPYDYRIRLAINDGNGFFTDGTDGEFTGMPPAPIGDGWFPYGLLTGDFDGDGTEDLVVQGGCGRLYLNDGHGRFRDATNGPGTGFSGCGGGIHSSWGTVGDFDGDGDLDIASVYPDYSWLLVNDGFGLFTDGSNGPYTQMPPSPDPRGDFFSDLLGGDLDRDGDLDLVATVQFGQNRVWINGGVGNYLPVGTFVDETLGDLNGVPRLPAQPSVTPSPFSALADVDRDGELDVFLSNAEPPYGSLYLNDGAGYFVDTRGNPLSGVPEGLGGGWERPLADLDGDGDLDLMLRGVWDLGQGQVRLVIVWNE